MRKPMDLIKVLQVTMKRITTAQEATRVLKA